jgi:hypothetical protein
MLTDYGQYFKLENRPNKLSDVQMLSAVLQNLQKKATKVRNAQRGVAEPSEEGDEGERGMPKRGLMRG